MTVSQTSSSATKLFAPIKLGDIQLKHRVVMAPMTRLRADFISAEPSDMMVDYYARRATDGGLIISEAISPSKDGKGWPCQPGLWSQEQVVGWKKITDAVHAKGAKMIAQICLAGRVAMSTATPTVYAPSNLHDPTPGAEKPELKVMDQDDIDQAIRDFTLGAENAIAAGFDGVEVHCANGYLLDQFINSTSNQRTDAYGGSLANRFRFPIAIITSIASSIGAQRVGVRISPFATYQGMREPGNPLDTFVPFVEAVLDAAPDLGYFHGLMPRANGADDQESKELVEKDSLDPIRDVLVKRGVPFIIAGGFVGENAKEHTEKYDDLIAFGRYFTSNPDLPARIRNNYPLQKYDRATFYTQTAPGYNE
ncbi:hypothetical protein I317_00505 [Kwoniella heveanensis CBS 569]|nr:hypothetical protein I317_00505 [Kwoniella heveanensis CBS 569]